MAQLICKDLYKLNKALLSTNKVDRFNETIRFVLVENDFNIVGFDVILEKFNGRCAKYSSAEIQYCNMTLGSPIENIYSRKGYVKEGLRLLTEFMMNYELAYFHLDINPDNIGSVKVALANGYEKKGDSYYLYHPNHDKILYDSLGDNILLEVKKFIMKNNSRNSDSINLSK